MCMKFHDRTQKMIIPSPDAPIYICVYIEIVCSLSTYYMLEPYRVYRDSKITFYIWFVESILSCGLLCIQNCDYVR